MSACEAAGRWRWAGDVLNSMGRAHLVPLDASFNVCISACHKGQASSFGAAMAAYREQWHQALDAFQKMRSLSLELSEPNCTALLNACVRGARWKTALELSQSAAAPEFGGSLAASACEASEVPAIGALSDEIGGRRL